MERLTNTITAPKGLTDIHIHFCAAGRLKEFLRFCEDAGIARAGLVSLPDRKIGNFNAAVKTAIKADPRRFIGFGSLDHRLSRTETGGAEQVKLLAAEGFRGLKLWLGKPAVQEEFDLRMEDEYITGALKAAADHEMPVLIHLADPPEFWKPGGPLCPVEREKRPELGKPSEDKPAGMTGSFGDWIARGRMLFSRFPEITFIGAHLLFLAGSIEKIDEVMGAHPNLLLDTAPGRWFYRILAEQRAEASDFFTRQADRILLGSDSMFFPEEFTTFPPAGLKENSKTLARICRFLSAGRGDGGRDREEMIEDPYPWSDYAQTNAPGEAPGLPCLGLEEDVLLKIMKTNADTFFTGAVK